MCIGRARDTVTIDREQYRRLIGLEKDIRAAIDGANLERLFRAAYIDRNRGDYDLGLYEGNKGMAERVLGVLPKELPF